MEKISEIVGNYISDNRLIPSNVFKEIVKLNIEKENLEEFIKSIRIGKNCISRYSYIDRKIYFNPFNSRDYDINRTQTLTKLLSKEEINGENVINPNSFNILNLFYLSHEINHAIQFRDICGVDNYEQLEEKSPFSTYIYLLSIYVLSKKEVDQKLGNKYYNNFHNYFYSEYNANINSFIYVLYLLNSLNIKELNKLLKKFNKLISSDLLNLYKSIDNKELSSPIQNFINLKNRMIDDINAEELDNDIIEIIDFFQSEIDKFNSNNQFENLKIGSSINENAQNYLLNVSKGKKKTLNLFEDIKNIS